MKEIEPRMTWDVVQTLRPWENEPNEVFFTHLGLPCCIVRHVSFGHLCGYVGVDPGHPFHGLNYDAQIEGAKEFLKQAMQHPKAPALWTELYELREQGVLGETISLCTLMDVHGGLTYADNAPPIKVEGYDGYWWFGFDCAHLGDLVPILANSSFHQRGEYRTFEYVKDQVRRLAEQLVIFAMYKSLGSGE